MRLSRYAHRFGGEGTITTLEDGRAFTAAHCIAAIDGRPGRLIAGVDGAVWRLHRRWSPQRLDLALLEGVIMPPPARGRTGGPQSTRSGGITLAARAMLRAGADVSCYVPAGTGFRMLQARVVSVTATTAVAEVRSRRGVRGGDSGGPVLMGGVLVGIVTHRLGAARGGGAACLRCVRLDAPNLRARLRRAGGRA